jgi:hypothetical protein
MDASIHIFNQVPRGDKQSSHLDKPCALSIAEKIRNDAIEYMKKLEDALASG